MDAWHVVFVEARERRRKGSARAQTREAHGRGETAGSGGGTVRAASRPVCRVLSIVLCLLRVMRWNCHCESYGLDKGGSFQCESVNPLRSHSHSIQSHSFPTNTQQHNQWSYNLQDLRRHRRKHLLQLGSSHAILHRLRSTLHFPTYLHAFRDALAQSALRHKSLQILSRKHSISTYLLLHEQ